MYQRVIFIENKKISRVLKNENLTKIQAISATVNIA
jgi:hypothetical protein